MPEPDIVGDVTRYLDASRDTYSRSLILGEPVGMLPSPATPPVSAPNSADSVVTFTEGSQRDF